MKLFISLKIKSSFASFTMNFTQVARLTILLLHAASISYAIEIPEHLRAHAKKLHNQCQQETNVSTDLMKNNDVLPDDRQLQCYLHCIFDKVGLIDDKHVIHLENILEILPTESHGVIMDLVEKCGTKHGADGCETAYLTVKCYLETNPGLKAKFDFVFD